MSKSEQETLLIVGAAAAAMWWFSRQTVSTTGITALGAYVAPGARYRPFRMMPRNGRPLSNLSAAQALINAV